MPGRGLRGASWRAAMLALGLAVFVVASEAPANGAKNDAALEASYQRYLTAIRTARNTIQSSPLIRDAADRAQGDSFLKGIVDYSLAAALDLTPDHPLLEALPRPNEREGFNNPDNLYYVARVSDQGSYRITGTRGTSTGFLVQAFSHGLPGYGTAAGATTASVADTDLHPAADGSFSITLSAQRPAKGDWMQLAPGTDNLLVRFSFLDWQQEKRGSIKITRIGGSPSNRAAMTPVVAAAMLDDAAQGIQLQAQFYRDQGVALSSLGANKLIGPRQAQGQQGTNVQQWNLTGNYDLAADQALLVTIKDAPQAKYSGFMAATPFLDTLEFVHHQVSLNHDQVHVDSDGNIRYVLSAQDPGVPNWIDTTGQLHGTIFGRWQEVPGVLGPEYAPTLTVLPLSGVRAALPPDTPTVTRAQRAAQLAQRQRLLQARFTGADPKRSELLRRFTKMQALVGHKIAGQSLFDTGLRG
ncbi:MAG: hypothetical protein JWL73_2561 [Actinomycetia bacterium]|nr:hypothetical protein [Actinomycetes bacterium]